jgi:photoactive yellow protein
MVCDISQPMVKKGSKTVTIGISATPELKKQFDEFADNLQRSSSWLGLKFLLRGWERFNQDGLFEEPPASTSVEVYEPEQRATSIGLGKDTSLVADRDRKDICMFCGKRAKDRLCIEHRDALIGDPKMTHKMLDDLLYGVMELDRDGKILAYNRHESEMARISHKRAINKNFFTQIAKCDEVKEMHEIYNDFLKGDAAMREFDIIYPFKHGETHVHISFVRVDENRALVITKKIENERGRKTG